MLFLKKKLMLILFLLQLKSGQNPYKILGIAKDSNDQQIKTAYHKLARKYHPDVSKEKDAERKFIEATDAYELLKDKRRRQIYDQTGSVSEIPDEKDQQRKYEQFRNFQRQFLNIKFSTPYVDENSIDSELGSSSDCLVMIYSSRYWGVCIDFIYFFEDIARQYKYIIKFMRNDASKSKVFMKESGASSIPNVVYAYRNSKGKLSYKNMDRSVNDRTSFLAWMIQCWDFTITRLKSVDEAILWLEKDPGLTHVLSATYENEPTIEMKRIATIYGYQCKFAILTITNNLGEIYKSLNITRVPEYHIYRRSGNQILDDLSIDLKDFVKPQFTRLKQKSPFFECRQFCVVYIGTPTQFQIKKYISSISENLAYIDANSTFAKVLKLKNTQFIFFEGLKRRYFVIQNKENISKEIEKYRKNALLMKSLPVHLNVDYDFRDQFDDLKDCFYKVMQKLEGFSLMEAISELSTEFIVTGFLILLLFLFCCF